MTAQVECETNTAEAGRFLRAGEILALAATPTVHEQHAGELVRGRHKRAGERLAAGDSYRVEFDFHPCSSLIGEHAMDASVIAIFPRPDTSEPNLFNFPSMSLLAKLSVGRWDWAR